MECEAESGRKAGNPESYRDACRLQTSYRQRTLAIPRRNDFEEFLDDAPGERKSLSCRGMPMGRVFADARTLRSMLRSGSLKFQPPLRHKESQTQLPQIV